MKAVLDPDHPLSLDPLTAGPLLMKYRKDHLEAMAAAQKVLEEVDTAFGKQFGRSYGSGIETYRLEDADIVLVTIAGMSGTAKDAVDIARNRGIKAGLVRIRFTRPFPAQRIADALAGKKAFSVVDRSCCFGWSQGPMHMEVKAALADQGLSACHFSTIGGLGGADISLEDLLQVLDMLEAGKNDPGEKPVHWLLKD